MSLWFRQRTQKTPKNINGIRWMINDMYFVPFWQDLPLLDSERSRRCFLSATRMAKSIRSEIQEGNRPSSVKPMPQRVSSRSSCWKTEFIFVSSPLSFLFLIELFKPEIQLQCNKERFYRWKKNIYAAFQLLCALFSTDDALCLALDAY